MTTSRAGSVAGRRTPQAGARPGWWTTAIGRLAILLAFAVAMRAVTFGNPLVHVDEQFYLLVAHRMLGGALPYVDVWDRKSLGLFVLYLPAALFGPVGGVWAYQMLALAAVVATAWLIARLAALAGWGRGRLLAALLYIAWLGLADGQGGQAPVYYNLLVAGAALLVGRAAAATPWRTGIAAMALIGCALQIKYTVVVEGAWLGLWLLGAAWRGGARGLALARFALSLIAVAAAPTFLAFAAYAGLGHADAWLFANFTSFMTRGSDPVGDTIGNLVMLLATLAPLVLLALFGLRYPAGQDPKRHWSVFLRGWLAAALIGVLAFGSWFDHYALPAMVPAAICAAAFLANARWGRIVGAALLVVAVVAGQKVDWALRQKRGTPAQLAAVMRAIDALPPGCLFVYGDEPAIYTQSPRCTLTRYLFPSHLTLDREGGAIGVDQMTEVKRILAARPAVVVMRPAHYDDGEVRAIHAMAEASLKAEGYRLATTLPLGFEPIFLYARPQTPAASSRPS